VGQTESERGRERERAREGGRERGGERERGREGGREREHVKLLLAGLQDNLNSSPEVQLSLHPQTNGIITGLLK